MSPSIEISATRESPSWNEYVYFGILEKPMSDEKDLCVGANSLIEQRAA